MIPSRSFFLMEPEHLSAAYRRARLPPCPSARELVDLRRQRLAIARQAAAATRPAAAGMARVGVIPIIGPIQQRLTPELVKNGGTSTEEIGYYLAGMLADPGISQVVLQIDSPGGSSYGIAELAETIYRGRWVKPILAIADSSALSAAYWLGSAATALYATEGGDVGSIGVYMMHVDESKAADKEGVSVSFVHAGKYKVEGHPFEPLGAEARAHWQASVDETYGRFTRAVARYRGLPLSTVQGPAFGEGRWVSATAAVGTGLVDGIMSFDALLEALGRGSVQQPRRDDGPTAEVLRMRQAQRKRMTKSK